MRIYPILSILITLLAFLTANVYPVRIPSEPASPEWQSRVDPWVLENAASGETEFLISLNEQADLSGALGLKTQAAKGRLVVETLVETARRTQAPILRRLEEAGATYKAYWISNLIWVRGEAGLIQELASRPDVAHLYANPWVELDILPDKPVDEIARPAAINTIEWNIARVNADQVWAAGFTGQGVVIGGQDTGYEWDHPALKNQYRGWDSSTQTANHAYSWHDAIQSGSGNECGFDSPFPCDDRGHGTHTMGIMVGDDGSGNQIGMAPGARWIGCRNMENGLGSPQTYLECYQWFVAPTDLNNTNPRPELAPQVINNSWSCPPEEGCTDPLVLQQVVQNVHAAGILTVHSAGNSGPTCSTVNTPAAIYAESFTVGNTTPDDTISPSSSRGPVTVDGSERLKPDISAPGTNIRSSYAGGGYTQHSGTSMAGPHVAGLGALLISANPLLRGQVDELETIIQQSAVPLTPTTACGEDIAGVSVPNNTYGWGRIDALHAYEYYQLEVSATSSASVISPGEVITYTLSAANSGEAGLSSITLINELSAGITFQNASNGGVLDGNQIIWALGNLAVGEIRQVQFSVSTPTDRIGPIINANYYASSDQVISAHGPPLSVWAAHGILYQPLIPYLAP
ncbi:MAG TPA: S8 family serine peptidase [Anaerolineales bacterium]|nr:S8 family serine peptidase [Anaerolineales bacterium]